MLRYLQPNSQSFASSTNFSNVTPFVHSVISSVTRFPILVSSSKHQFVCQENTLQVLFNDKNVSPRLVPIDEDSKLPPKVSKGRKNPYQEDTNDYFQEEGSNKHWQATQKNLSNQKCMTRYCFALH